MNKKKTRLVASPTRVDKMQFPFFDNMILVFWENVYEEEEKEGKEEEEEEEEEKQVFEGRLNNNNLRIDSITDLKGIDTGCWWTHTTRWPWDR